MINGCLTKGKKKTTTFVPGPCILMESLVKEQYVAPAAEVVEVATVSCILDMSQQDYVYVNLDGWA